MSTKYIFQATIKNKMSELINLKNIYIMKETQQLKHAMKEINFPLKQAMVS